MCEQKTQVFAEGVVTRSSCMYGNERREPAYYLWIGVQKCDFISPKPGQFFMLRLKGSKHTLGRPISVFATRVPQDPSDPLERKFEYGFLILEKGEGTKELARLMRGTKVEMLGPLGNGFPIPPRGAYVCLVGGGVGVAPIMFLARELAARRVNAFDVYAGFKDSCYGLDYTDDLNVDNLVVTTESGRVGEKGTINVVLDANVLRKKEYGLVYACGPTPMLEYVQKICSEAGIKCYLSLENRMACGEGACLGCTIHTTEGNKRCCKDGPVFDGATMDFSYMKGKKILLGKGKDFLDLSVEIAGVKFKNPVIAASGTFGYGTEYSDLINVERLGGICSKGLTYKPRAGNKGVRIHEVSGGMMNSIGLENPGVEHFCKNGLENFGIGTVKIANLSGSSIEEYVAGADLLDKESAVDMIELNISCPNVKSGGMSFGMDPISAYDVTAAVRSYTTKPLIVKLTPNAPNLVAVSDMVRSAGADAISLVNTFQALAIDIETGRPVFDNVYAGLSGPGIKPLALRMVYQVAKNMTNLPKEKRIPIIGLGGITTWQDAVEFIMAGATCVQVGTATFANPNAMVRIIDGIATYMVERGFARIEDFRGVALKE